jgi:hypothetical protein
VWAELVRAGADEKQVLLPGKSGEPQLQIVVGAPPPRTRVLARMAQAAGLPALLVVDRRPGVPTADELSRRQSLATALLANPPTVAGPRARTVLGSAAVDQRLLTVLAALGAQYGVGIRDLPPAPGEPTGTLARHALVDRFGGESLSPGSAATTRLVGWLSAQLPPFRADSVRVVDGGVLIGYRYVSAPDALVSREAP